MESQLILKTLFLSVLPISELRGAIPFAIAGGMPFLTAYLIAVTGNAIISPFVFFFLSTFHRLFSRIPLYEKLFDRFVERTRKKIASKVERYGYVGVMLFVAIPLPVTGAWTGTLGAWVMGLKKRGTIPMITLGVMISGVIVTLISIAVIEYGIDVLGFFIKGK